MNRVINSWGAEGRGLHHPRRQDVNSRTVVRIRRRGVSGGGRAGAAAGLPCHGQESRSPPGVTTAQLNHRVVLPAAVLWRSSLVGWENRWGMRRERMFLLLPFGAFKVKCSLYSGRPQSIYILRFIFIRYVWICKSVVLIDHVQILWLKLFLLRKCYFYFENTIVSLSCSRV